jgi:haloacetate dehalogenase
VTINLVKGGEGPPVLLLHGAPQSHITWRQVAPRLAEDYTVIAADLRGYGDSSKPASHPQFGGTGAPDGHVRYSKRNMAQDQVDVMRHFGFDRFAVIGQDRGGRVTHRMLLDHPALVTKAAVLDILPTYYLYTHVTMAFIQTYYHWFSYVRAAPAPENDLIAGYDNAALKPPASDVQAEYRRVQNNPAGAHGMCEDYRAAASIDLVHDAADIDTKIGVPLLVLWADPGAMARLYDVLAVWRERGTHVTGRGMPGGHNMQEGAPEAVTERTAGVPADVREDAAVEAEGVALVRHLAVIFAPHTTLNVPGFRAPTTSGRARDPKVRRCAACQTPPPACARGR